MNTGEHFKPMKIEKMCWGPLRTRDYAICYRIKVSRASGTPCGSSSCLFCILCSFLLFLSLSGRFSSLGPIPNESLRNLLQNERLESFWDALWLELWPFLSFYVVFNIFVSFQGGFRPWDPSQTNPCAICHNYNQSALSGTPCGSSYGHFCFLT